MSQNTSTAAGYAAMGPAAHAASTSSAACSASTNRFLVGSTVLGGHACPGHEAYYHPQAGPSSRADATVAPASNSGYSYSPSVWQWTSSFAPSTSLADAAQTLYAHKFPGSYTAVYSPLVPGFLDPQHTHEQLQSLHAVSPIQQSSVSPYAYHSTPSPQSIASTSTSTTSPMAVIQHTPGRQPAQQAPLTAAQLLAQGYTPRTSPMAVPYPSSSSRRQSVDSTASLSTGSTRTSGTPAMTPPPPPPPPATSTPLPPVAVQDTEERDDPTERRRAERRHACWMCHKAFDRPSTLRKHLFVHTGEKAFQCEICSRRFSVQSNLNRHAKRCRARFQGENPAADKSASTSGGADENASANTTETEGSSSSSAASSTTLSDSTSPSSVGSTPSRGRKRAASADPPSTNSDASATAAATPCSTSASPPSSAADNTTASSASASAQPKRKRRRRAPSPLAWIPDSLRMFDLTPYAKSTPVPLPPVVPFEDAQNRVYEERDSYDNDVSVTPYHPNGWSGKLPGPALMGVERGVGGLAGCGVLILQ